MLGRKVQQKQEERRKSVIKNESDQSTCMQLSEEECPQVQSQPGTQIEHQGSKGYIEILSQKVKIKFYHLGDGH